jgi:hypothetical protein
MRVLLARKDYEALLKRARAAEDEDAGTARVIARSRDAIAAGHDAELPAEVAEAIVRGENALRVIRRWRGLTQAQLGDKKTDIGQGMISALEKGTRRGTAAVWKRLAAALGVPMQILIPE